MSGGKYNLYRSFTEGRNDRADDHDGVDRSGTPRACIPGIAGADPDERLFATQQSDPVRQDSVQTLSHKRPDVGDIRARR